jgi:hypothetical protein
MFFNDFYTSDSDDSNNDNNNLPFDEIVNEVINPYGNFIMVDGKKLDKEIYLQFIRPKEDKIKLLEKRYSH